MATTHDEFGVYGDIDAAHPLDWLCIAPHPDDAEIGAGGTLIRLAQQGRKVGILELTRGERGTQGTSAERQLECQKAAQIMGLHWRGQLGFPDGELSDRPDFAHTLAQVLRLLRPRVLLIPHHQDRHPDHFGSYHLSKRALHLATLQKADIQGAPHRCERVLLYQGNNDINANVLIDIGDDLRTWQTAIEAHQSQFSGARVSETVTPEIIERRKARLRYWGTLARSHYAEAFESETALLFEPTSL